MFLPLFLVLPPKLEEGALKLTVLDVGQGLAVVAQTRNHALLYDAGPAFGPGADSGNRIIVPYLRAAGVQRLDGMIVSHDNADHSGGAVSVFQALPVAALFTSLPDMDPLPLEAEQAFRCFAGQNWEWDGVRFEMLHPSRASYDQDRIRDNDRSCVLRIVTARRRGAVARRYPAQSGRGIVVGAARRVACRCAGRAAPWQQDFIDAGVRARGRIREA